MGIPSDRTLSLSQVRGRWGFPLILSESAQGEMGIPSDTVTESGQGEMGIPSDTVTESGQGEMGIPSSRKLSLSQARRRWGFPLIEHCH